MGRINLLRVVIGGALAGILVNVSEFLLHDVVFKAKFEEGMKELGRPFPSGGAVMTTWILWGFAVGIAAVWLYAAIRPRYGQGAGTAARAGVAVWFFTWLLSMVALQNMGVFPIMIVAFFWTLVECIVATVAGAWLYREGEA
jgi:hypothetical protein